MGSDACFRMGSTHAICQDYAIAGAHQGAPYAILSDGCSGLPIEGEPGSPYTDFGSRFLARAAWLSLIHRGERFDERAIIERAGMMAHNAYFQRPALDATLLAAIQRDRSVTVYQAGDGVVAARHRITKQLSYTTLKFDENMPFYLNYLRSQGAMVEFLAKCKAVTVTSGIQIAPGQWTETNVEVPLGPDSSPVRRHDFNDEYDLVLIMSDGAESFQTQDNQPVPLTDVLEQLLAIKGFEGEFLTRRCTRFLTKFCAEKRWKHTDDLSVAGIYIPPQAEDVQP